MKNKILYVILVVIAGIGVQSFAAEVTNVELSYVNGSTVANIHVDGTIRFTHQTEEAKDGKPFRVIVDVLSATHELGAKNFTQLPECSIQKLRSSQFSVSPEKIVRIVFDMETETFYSIKSIERTINVSFPDKSHRQFTTWSSRAVVEAMRSEKKAAPKLATAESRPEVTVPEKSEAPAVKTAGAINQSIEKDRQTSLASSTAAPAKTTSGTKSKTEGTKPLAQKPTVQQEATTTEKKSPPVPYKSRNTYGPDYAPELFATSTPEKQPAAKVADADKDVATKAESMPSVKKTTPTPPSVKPESSKSPVLAKDKSDSKTPPVEKSPSPEKVTQEKKPAAPAVAKSQPATEKAKPTTVATKPKKESKSSTSRFRRSASSKKIKGTLVAEFPKRLVIKYKSRSTRDPFETLVNETRVNNSVIERSVPNVEGLKLVGVIESLDSDNRALFEDNSGYGYILKSGDKVRKGYVLRVESNRVYFQIFEYGWSRTVALNLEEN